MKITINESRLKEIIAESVYRILNEGSWDASNWIFPSKSQQQFHNDTIEEFIEAYYNEDYNKCNDLLDYIYDYNLCGPIEYKLSEKMSDICNDIRQNL